MFNPLALVFALFAFALSAGALIVALNKDGSSAPAAGQHIVFTVKA